MPTGGSYITWIPLHFPAEMLLLLQSTNMIGLSRTARQMCLYPKQLQLTFPERWTHKVHKGKKINALFIYRWCQWKDSGSSDGPTFCTHSDSSMSINQPFPPCTPDVFLWCNQGYQQGMLPSSCRLSICEFSPLFVSHEQAALLDCSPWHSLTEWWGPIVFILVD